MLWPVHLLVSFFVFCVCFLGVSTSAIARIDSRANDLCVEWDINLLNPDFLVQRPTSPYSCIKNLYYIIISSSRYTSTLYHYVIGMVYLLVGSYWGSITLVFWPVGFKWTLINHVLMQSKLAASLQVCISHILTSIDKGKNEHLNLATATTTLDNMATAILVKQHGTICHPTFGS